MLAFDAIGMDALGLAGDPVQGGGTPVATVSSATISPSIVSLQGGAQQQFSATVTGTNNPAQTVTWSASAGSINSTGLFTAPSATGSAQTFTITATSTVDGSKSGTATVTVAAQIVNTGATVSGVSVAPASGTVQGGTSMQFIATVAGTGNPQQDVTWTASIGSISSGGLWTAPATSVLVQSATITATSVLDPSKSGRSTMTVPAFDVPSAPLGVSATAGMGVVAVVVTPPASNGGSPITGYLVTASTGQVIASAGTSLVFTLPEFVRVSFVAQAVNVMGLGPTSLPSATVIPLPVESTDPADYTTVPAPRERVLSM